MSQAAAYAARVPPAGTRRANVLVGPRLLEKLAFPTIGGSRICIKLCKTPVVEINLRQNTPGHADNWL
eukprot:1010997-Lingulodinium_polyedra.AAC.1